jgi:hypothetical protein
MGFDLGSLLQQYIGGATPPAGQVQDHYDQVSQNSSGGLLSTGLAAAFRSDATPPFGQMAGQLFGQSNPNQQAGMLNTMIAGMGPAVLGALLGKAGGAGGALGGLGGLLGQLTGGGSAPQITPAQASTLTPDQVQVIASHAEQANPGIIDQMSNFYAQHPTLVKTLGSAALSIAMAKMAEAHRA